MMNESYHSKVGTWLESVTTAPDNNVVDSTVNYHFVKQQNDRLADLTKQLRDKEQLIEDLNNQNRLLNSQIKTTDSVGKVLDEGFWEISVNFAPKKMNL